MLLRGWKEKLHTGKTPANNVFGRGFVFRIYTELSKFNNKKATQFSNGQIYIYLYIHTHIYVYIHTCIHIAKEVQNIVTIK